MAVVKARMAGARALAGAFSAASAAYGNTRSPAVRSLGQGAEKIVRPLERRIRRGTPVDKGVLKKSTDTAVEYYPSRLGSGALVRVRAGWFKKPARAKVVRNVVEYGANYKWGRRTGRFVIHGAISYYGQRIKRELEELARRNQEDEIKRATGRYKELQTFRYFRSGVKPVTVQVTRIKGPPGVTEYFTRGPRIPTTREYFSSGLKI